MGKPTMDKKNRRQIFWISTIAGLMIMGMVLTIERSKLEKILSILIALTVFLIIRWKVKKEPVLFLLVQSVVLFIFAVLAFLFQLVIIEPTAINTRAMSPVLDCGKILSEYGESRKTRGADRVWIIKLPFRPQRGDLVAFRNPMYPRMDIKRCIGLPGEHIKIEGNRILIDGKELEQKYSHSEQGNPDLQVNMPVDVQISPDHYFFLGDNRDNSFDSRMYGAVTRKSIIGKVKAIYWPLRRMKLFQ